MNSNKKTTPPPFYNIYIIDQSNIYALGLKNTIEKCLNNKAHFFVFHYKNIEEINTKTTSSIDILFIDYCDLLHPNFNSILMKLKRKNPKLKLIVSTSDLLQIDFSKLFTFHLNGLFSKSLSIKAFSVYFKRVLAQTVFIDNFSLKRVVEEEKKQKIKLYYKSVSLHNLEFIQNRNIYFSPYFIDKDSLKSINN